MKNYRGGGLAYIRSQLLTGGGVVSYSSGKKQDFSAAISYRTTFFPSLILLALAGDDSAAAKVVKKQLAKFLLAQKSEYWSFNYWDRASTEHTKLPYPDDLDDTFCALAALWHYDAKLFTGEVTAAMVQLLITNETVTGGPYRTWLVGEDSAPKWRDIDLVVNANIGYFLSLQGVELKNVVELLETAIAGGTLASPYYPDEYPLLYFAARWYRGGLQKQFVELLLRGQTEGVWGDSLCTALSVSALLHLGYPADKLHLAQQYLLRSQQADGSWPAAAFCIDPARQGKTHYAGSAALTTAFCLEALDLFEQQAKPLPKKPSKVSDNQHYIAVKKTATAAIAKLGHADLARHTTVILQRIVARDTDRQIILLPWFIAKATKLQTDEKTLQQLAMASLWGWMAYTTYDDFLDGDGDKKQLPSANFCLRQLVATLKATLPGCADFQAEATRIMHRVDAANSWELSHCRADIADGKLRLGKLPDYGDYWQLADRSLGHTIAALGVLYSAGLGTSSPQHGALRSFFKHYLIARQLHDDAHDWEEDLRAGHINAAAVPILHAWRKMPGNTHKKLLDLSAQAETLRTIMWEDVIGQTCQDIHAHIALARAALAAAPGFFDTKLLSTLLEPLEAGANEAVSGRDEALAFIGAL